jgi:hypothetical protein
MAFSNSFKPWFTLMTLLLIVTLISGCWNQNAGEDSFNSKAQAAEFASYTDYPVNVTPNLLPYQVAEDLGNIENISRFELSPAAREMLAKNYFFVTPFWGEEFFALYEPNRYDGIPNFITTDSMLHNYHLFFNHLLEVTEQEHFIPALKDLNRLMLDQSLKQYQKLEGSKWENAAKRNLAFFAVGSRLLDPQVQVPDTVQTIVAQEIDLIKEHRQMALSPLMSMGIAAPNEMEELKEDYTQYIPRGHYTKSEELEKYFQNMMWYGRMTFRLKSEDETRSALLITLALKQEENLKNWLKIYEPTSFLVGKSDDLSFFEYQELLSQVYGNSIKLQELSKSEDKWQEFLEQAQKLNPPQINSIPIFDEELQPDRESEIKGFRFMGQRYTLDADIFQRLIYREVKENKAGERRLLPRGLDIPAAMGSQEAVAILKDLGDWEYAKYPENMGKMQSYIDGLDKSSWTQNLYWSWLYTLKTSLGHKAEGYPSFMLKQAWDRKELNTFLGSWTELKHDTILYTKQVYADEMGGGIEGQVDDRGYVEPNPELYGRLASLSRMTREGLEKRQLISNRDKENLERMETLALALKEIAEKELGDTPRTEEEYDLIRSYGGQLEHFWLEALRDENSDLPPKAWENPAALIADVATAPPDLVLEEGTGYISEIYVVVPLEGSLRIARGGVYTYYEFPWPASDRLTDQKWRQMLQDQQAPEAPAWTKVFTAEGPCHSLMPQAE